MIGDGHQQSNRSAIHQAMPRAPGRRGSSEAARPFAVRNATAVEPEMLPSVWAPEPGARCARELFVSPCVKVKS
jgi:hypothetical protein